MHFHKPGKCKTNPTSYRPISLLSTLSKLLEKIIHSRLNTYISQQSILPPFQFGFRPKYSTTHQLARIHETIVKGFENKQYTTILFLDIAQAFDRVWHNGLLYKLIQLQIPEYITNIISAFLRERTFASIINTSISETKNIQAGVPQGSILGPLLFNIFMHDIPVPPNCSLAMFADDTALITQTRDLNGAIQALQSATDHLLLWFNRWNITLNPTKVSAKIFTLRQFQNPTPIVINGNVIPWNPKEEAVKYLGVYLDQKLTWGIHINIKINDCHHKMRLLYPILNRNSSLKIECALLIYKSILRSALMYACVVWGAASKTHVNKLQVLQNKVIRTATNAPWYVRNDQLHRELNIAHIQDFIKITTNKFLANLRACPAADHYTLGQRSTNLRLKPRLPQDVLLSDSD